MPNNRTIAACVALSFLAHLVIVAAASLVPWTSRVPESVMVVDLADLPRTSDFLPPKPGILEGGRPKPPPPKADRQARAEEKAIPPPRVMEGRVPDLPVNPALPPEERFPPQKPRESPSAPPSSPPPEPQPAPRADEKPASPGSSGSSGKPLKDLNPSLGKMVLALGESASRGTGSTAGKTVGSGGKAGEKGEIVEEGGEGTHLTALNAP
ncbi:MAG TPA: hypothetical protein VK863_08005, partial [Candidatus Limnocylindrales bacterium]|nr:hypothetical protein [Candidatus Limnocylindrales bacterium]